MNTAGKEFSALSVNGQINRIQAAFSISAQSPALSTETDRKLQTLVRHAAAAVQALQANGKLTGSRSHTIYSRWIRLLDHKDQYRLHVHFMQKFIQTFSQQQPDSGKLDLQLYPYSTLLKYEQHGNLFRLRLQETMIRMPDTQIRDLAAAVSAQNKPAISGVINSFMQNPKSRELLDYFMEGLPHKLPSEKSKGSFFDLEAVFERINRDYFGGELEKPRLKWSAQANKRRMGTYNFQTDTIMINKALDCRKTPRQVVDFVMYHEMLHKALGYKTSRSGRRQAHTATFRTYERSFPNYAEIEHYLNHLKV